MNKRLSGKKFVIAAFAVVFAVIAVISVVFTGCSKNNGKPQYKTDIVSREIIGCGGYGAVHNSQIDPYNENYFAAICDMGGVYFSYDKGKSWLRHNVKGTLYTLEYDVTNEGVVWFAGSGLYKSYDHGKTIEMVFPKEEQITSAGNNYENINYWLYTEGQSDYAPHYQINGIAINRKSDGNEVFCAQRIPAAGMGYNQCVRVYRATDGENFALFSELPYSYNFKIDFDEGNDCLVYVTKDRIYEIDKNGDIACVIEQPVKVQHINGNSMSFDSYYDKDGDKNTFVFSADVDGEHIASACYKTNNLRDKNSYINLTEELIGLNANDLGVDGIADYNRNLKSYEYCEWIQGDGPVRQQFKWTVNNVCVLNDNVVYLFHEATTPTYKSDGSLYLNRRTSAYLKYDARKSGNERFSWIYGFPLKPYNETITNSSWQDADARYSFGMSSFSGNDGMLLFCNNVGIYCTENGKTVRQLNSNPSGYEDVRLSDGTNIKTEKLQRVSTTGVDVVCTQTVATDPFDKNHILMGCTDIGILQSYDNAESWYRGLYEWQDGTLKDIKYAVYTNTCYDIHFDRERRGVVYALWSQVQNAPYSAAENYITSQGRFGVSYDGGLSWTMKKITPDGCCLPYRMQVVYEGNERKIYIADDGRGFFFTDNSGESFTEMNDGIDAYPINGKTAIWGNEILVCDMGIFAVTGGLSANPDTGRGFYKWNGELNKFEKIALPATDADGKTYPSGVIRDIAYDKNNDCLYLARIANNVTNYKEMKKTAGGILKYKDGKFSQIYDEKVSVFSVNIDNSGRLYATEYNGRVARFDNNNTTYEILVEGLFHSLKRVCFGATDDVLYVPTWGGNTERIVLGKVRI